MRYRAALLALTLSMSASLCASAERPLGKEASQAVIDGWLDRMREIEGLLREERWKKAFRQSDDLLEEMKSRLWSGPGSAQLLGRGSALRAIAQAGKGDLEEARWDWDVALVLEPAVAGVEVSQFGKAAERLSKAPDPLAPDTSVDGARELDASEADLKVASGELSPPKKLHAPPPAYPRAKFSACKEEPLVVTVIIGTDGRPRSPRLDGKGDPVLFLSATDALRQWRFEPARVSGRAVEVTYNLTVNYRILFCKGVHREPGG